jgi:leucyl aminopeptidase (aminopeptidase T)
MSSKAFRGAMRLLQTCARVLPHEKVLLVADTPHGHEISKIMMEAASKIGVSFAAIIMKPRNFPGEEPPPFVADAMQESDVVICATSMTMFYTKARIAACKAGARIISMAGATASTFASNAMFANFEKQAKLGKRIAASITNASRIHVTTAEGTNLELNVEGRRGYAITGLCRKRGDAQGVPDIEVYVAPIEGFSRGVLVVDASTSVTGLVKTPIVMEIKHGAVHRIKDGDEVKRLIAMLRASGNRNSYRVAEFGIGLNPLAKLRGSIIEDEAVMGTAHIALGENRPLGGRNSAPIHVDFVFKRPKIELDGRLILKENRFLI